MTLPAMVLPISPRSSRVRIAITSPDILAQIRQVFAGKNLAVEIVSLPYVEVEVRPVAAALPGPRPVAAGTAPTRRLCAEYRLHVVDVHDRHGTGQSAPPGRRYPEPVPDPAPEIGAGADARTDRLSSDILSQRQHEVMALVSRGVRNADIAARLQVSEKTVKNHINRIFRGLGASSRVEAVLIWQRWQQGGDARREAPTQPPTLSVVPAPSR